MPCSSGSIHCKSPNCPVKADVEKWERVNDERARIQLQVLEILMSDADTGKRIECTRQDEIDATLHVAPLFAKAWAKGHRCPNLIATIIEGRMFGDGLATVVGTDTIGGE